MGIQIPVIDITCYLWGSVIVVGVAENLNSSAPAFRRSIGTAAFVSEPAEHGFALNSGTNRFDTVRVSDTAKGGL
jgi:hypothetical protein